MALPLVLARTFKEAHAFAKERLGLNVGHYRVNPSAGTIKAVRNTQIYLVPGWKKRSDRFGVQGALRYCRLEVIDVETWEQAPADPRGDLTERQLEVAYRYNTLLDLPAEGREIGTIAGTPVIEHESQEAADAAVLSEIFEPAADETGYIPHGVPTEVPKAKRRSRCKDCEQLHYKDEPCPELEG